MRLDAETVAFVLSSSKGGKTATAQKSKQNTQHAKEYFTHI